MRKIIVVENLTLDGVMEAPQKWSGPYQSPDIAAANKAGMGASDALLFGRVTYEEFAAYWPHQADEGRGFVDKLNNTTKYVVSASLKKADWQNTKIISGNLAAEITTLKQQPGKDIVVLGSATLVQSLMRDDLIDEYQLWLFPLVLGSGKRLFKEGIGPLGMKLTETKTFSSGAMLLSYAPAPAAAKS